MATPEFLITNLVDTASAISASSEETSLPVENVQNKSRTKVWRSDSGWNIVARRCHGRCHCYSNGREL
jgi:hypothetical protein